MFTRFWPFAVLVCLCSWDRCGTPVHSQEDQEETLPSEVSVFGRRYDGFRYLFAERGLQLGELSQFDPNRPADWILVLLGDSPPPDDFEDLSEFVSKGGSLLVARDWELASRPDSLENFAARVHPGPVQLAPDQKIFRKREELPIVDSWQKRDHPHFSGLLEGVNRLVLNSPGYLSFRKSSPLEPLANIFVRNPQSAIRIPKTVIAADQVKEGRVLVVADHSLFINEMILELDNLTFARNLVDWLIARPNGSRTKLFFLEDGRIVTQLVDPHFESGDWPSFPFANDLEFWNSVLTGIEDEDYLNQLLESIQGNLGEAPLRHGLFLFLSAILLLTIGSWLLRVRYDPPKPGKSATQEYMDKDLLELRRQSLLECENFIEPARQLAQQFFSRTLELEGWKTQEPTVTVNSDYWTSRQVKRSMRELWELATRRSNRKIGSHRFGRLQQELSKLEQHWQEGRFELH